MDNAQYMPRSLKATAGEIPAQLPLQVAVSSLASGLRFTVCMRDDIRLRFVLFSPVLWPRFEPAASGTGKHPSKQLKIYIS
jgi:hypothetical protein